MIQRQTASELTRVRDEQLPVNLRMHQWHQVIADVNDSVAIFNKTVTVQQAVNNECHSRMNTVTVS